VGTVLVVLASADTGSPAEPNNRPVNSVIESVRRLFIEIILYTKIYVDTNTEINIQLKLGGRKCILR